MKLTRYGRRELLLLSTAAGLVCAVVVVLAWATWWWVVAFGSVPLVLWLWVVSFFRDPDRSPPPGDSLLSPADGRVTDITPLDADSPLGCEGTRIGIFMSIFNVHVNRSPCDGTVQRVDYRKGAFLDARDPAAADRNESASIFLRAGDDGPLLVVRQVAGLIARRIVTDVRVGERVSRGGRIGMIKFSSRLELMVPKPMIKQVLVEIGQKVRAGETPLVQPAEGVENG
ncbi:MAG: phosphatidylserine decarboxylase [Phycisphaerae bacterium]